MCIAVTPAIASLTYGSVTDFTVFPAFSGRLTSYIETVSCYEVPLLELRYRVAATVCSPGAAVPSSPCSPCSPCSPPTSVTSAP